jgi:hypothetical protein
MQAQAVGVAGLALFGFFATWLFLAPPATLLYLLRRRPAVATPAATEQPAAMEEPLADAIAAADE